MCVSLCVYIDVCMCLFVSVIQGLPVGGVILNYLLEKSRVVRHTDGEENFHVFRELIYGADSSLLQTLHLSQDMDDYSYTQSQVSTQLVVSSLFAHCYVASC